MSDPNIFIDAHFDGMLTSGQARALHEWLLAAPDHALQFARRAIMHDGMHRIMVHEDLQGFLDVSPGSNLAGGGGEIDSSLILDAVAQERTAQAARIGCDAAEPIADHPRGDRIQREAPAGEPPKRHIVIPTWVAYGSVAALVVLVAALFLRRDPTSIVTPPPSATTPPMPRSSEPPPLYVGELRETVDAQWEGASFAVGDRLVADHYRLTHGLARIEFVDGAHVVIEAPAVFRLDSESSMRLERGRLVGRCETTESRGFTVRTPGARVTDLGTEFGMAVDERDRVSVCVFSGRVSVMSDHDEESTRQIGAGETVYVDEAGRFAQAWATPPSYLRSTDSQAVRDHRYAQAVLNARPLVYWRFDDWHGDEVRSATEASQSLRTHGGMEHGGTGNHWASFPTIRDDESNYLRQQQALTLNSPGTLTVEAWVRPSHFVEASVVHLQSVEHERSALAAIGLGGPFTVTYPHKVRFAVMDGGSERIDSVELISSEPYEVRQWMHIVGVIDGVNQRLYVNGRLVASHVNASITRDASDVRITLGRLSPTDEDISRHGPRQFFGDLDDVAIYERALTDAEIREHHALGLNRM